MKTGDYEGYWPSTPDDVAITAFLAKHPEEIGAELEVVATGGCLLVRRRHERGQNRQRHHGDVLASSARGGLGVAAGTGIGEVTDERA